MASGWHTAAISMRLLVGGGLPIAGGIVGAGGEIAWPKPTRPGALLHSMKFRGKEESLDGTVPGTSVGLKMHIVSE